MDIDERHPQLLAKDLKIERLESEIARLRDTIKDGYETQARTYQDASERAAAAQARSKLDLAFAMLKNEDTVCPYCGYKYDSDDMCEGDFYVRWIEDGTDCCPSCDREFRWDKLEVIKIITYKLEEE